MLSAAIVRKLCAHYDISKKDDLRCVITGERAFPYPLYSGRDTKPFFGNYIPLAPALIKQLAKENELSSILDHRNIQARYQAHLTDKKPVYAYACARLAVHVYKRKAYEGKFLSQIIERVADALYCNRGRHSPDLVVHTLRHDLRYLYEGAKVTPGAGLRLSLEVAAYLNEYGVLDEADKWLKLGLQFERISAGTSNQERARRSAVALRRQAQILLYSDPSNRQGFERDLNKAADLAPSGPLSMEITTATLKNCRAFVLGSNFREAAAASDRLFGDYREFFGEERLKGYTGGLSPATASELYYFSGIAAACLYKDVKLIEKRLNVGLDLMHKSGHRISPFLWRYVQRLREKSMSRAQAELITDMSSKYVNEVGLTAEMIDEFRYLKKRLQRIVPREKMSRQINAGIYVESKSGVVHINSDGVVNAALSPSQQSELVAKLRELENQIQSIREIRTEDKVAMTQAVNRVADARNGDESNIRQVISALRASASSILSNIAANEATSFLDNHVKIFTCWAESLLKAIT